MTAYPHGAIIDFDSVELSCSLVSAVRLLEHDGRNSFALAIWTIGEKDLLDRSDGL